MPAENINSWLRSRRRGGVIASGVYAAATILGGAVFLGVNVWIIFMGVKLILLSVFPLSSFSTVLSLGIAIAAAALLFLDSIRVSRDDMSSLPGWLLRECIDIGPRLILEGLPHAARSMQFAGMDLNLCARVLNFLTGKEHPVPKDELLRVFPGLDWDSLHDQLVLIEGVIFFHPDQNRVTLTTPLRLELRRLRTRARVHVFEPPPEPEPIPVTEPQQLSPAEILGVAPLATLAEIKSAYRNRIKECHPDRFATMDEHSRQMAEEWTKALNAAYETLVAQERSRGL